MESSPRKKFLFVIPVFQAVYALPFANFLAMCFSAASRESEHYEFIPYVPHRTILHSAMNVAAGHVLAQGFDGMIIADDDCTPPFDGISRLLRRYEEGHPIVAGMGYMRNPPFTTTIGRYYPEGLTIRPNPNTGTIEWAGFEWVDDVSQEPEDLIPADFCGFPLALVSVDALRRLERPWFGTHINGGDCTHDVYFGARAKAAGVPIVVDRTIDCGHLGDAALVHSGNRALARGVTAALQQALAGQ